MKPSPLHPKRSASISYASSPAKRARSVSVSVKVSHDSTPGKVLHEPEIPVRPKNPQACLGGVPEELLLYILKKLRGNPAALAKLCRTDRRCRRIAEEVLYNKVPAYAGAKARAIIATSRLALHVHSCSAEVIDDFDHPDYGKDKFTRIIAKAINIRTLSIRNFSVWRAEYPDDEQWSLNWLSLFDSATRQSVNNSVNSFSYLSDLTIAGDYITVEKISSVFRLPSLKAFQLDGVHQTTPFENWSIPNSSCPIQTLKLMDTMMDITAVTQIISAMKALRNFTYIRNTFAWQPFGSDQNALSNWPVHSWKLLGDALRKHQDSLETVLAWDISDKDIIDIVYPDGHNFGTLGSFRAFPNLKHCGWHIEAFLNVAAGEDDLSSYLPPNLRSFDIQISADISTLWAGHLSSLASLRNVKSVHLAWDGDLPTPALSNPLEILEQAGIELVLDINGKRVNVKQLKRLEE